METVEVMIKIPKQIYEKTLHTGVVEVGMASAYIGGAIIDGTVLPKNHGRLIDSIEDLLQKATNEVFVQHKQFNERFSKDWNEGFNDGMFHTLTIIKEIVKVDKEAQDETDRKG